MQLLIYYINWSFFTKAPNPFDTANVLLGVTVVTQAAHALLNAAMDLFKKNNKRWEIRAIDEKNHINKSLILIQLT